MRAVLAAVVTLFMLATTSLATAPTVNAAAEGITVRLAAPQQVGLDPAAASVAVEWRMADCAHGCELYRVRTLRSNYDEELLDSRTFPASPSPRTFTVSDTVENGPLGWTTSYELRRFAAGEGYAELVHYRYAYLDFGPEGAFRYGSGWRRDLNLTSTETMIMRSAAAGRTATLPVSATPRQVGIVSAKGPRNGVMAVAVDGVVRHTIDVYAATWQPRRIVATVQVPANARVTVSNATPSGRANRDVHVDGLAALTTSGGSAPAGRGDPARVGDVGAEARDVAAPREDIAARPAVPQQLSSPTATSFRAEVVARVLGCPSGCSIVRTTETGSTVLLTHTSPASPTLQTLRVVDTPDYASYTLRKGGTWVGATEWVSPDVRPDADFTYSWGWTRDGNRASTGGTIMRSATPGTGATYRVPGTFDGRSVGLVAARGPRNGVAAVYVDGVLAKQVDLSAPTWQPRQVVAAVDLPLTGRITVVNRTPAHRADKDVHIDGLAVLDLPDDWY